MEIHLQDDAAKKYGWLYVSSRDLELAQYYVGVILKKGWHYQPWEKRGTIYLQQSAFMSALVIAYARPFTKSRWGKKFSLDYVLDVVKEFNSAENKFHERMMDLRDTVYAHSDSKCYSVTPWRNEEFSTDIVSAPALRINAEKAALLQQMIKKLQLAIDRMMSQIAPSSRFQR